LPSALLKSPIKGHVHLNKVNAEKTMETIKVTRSGVQGRHVVPQGIGSPCVGAFPVKEITYG
jgi:hypothetical protein